MGCAVAGIFSCRRHRICTEEGSKRPVIPAQNKSVKWFLWNVTFHRLETMPLAAQEQWGEEL